MPRVLGLLALVGAIAWSAHLVRLHLATEETDDAFITGRVHRISAGVAGDVLEVAADDNQIVKAGEVLAKLDPLEYEIAEKQATATLAQAKARLAEAKARLAQAESAREVADADIAAANAEVEQRKSVLDLAYTTLQRNESLTKTRAVSKADLDQARGAMSAAQAGLNGSTAKLASAHAAGKSSASAIALAQAGVASAWADIDVRQAALAEARRQRDLTQVKAPVSGRIGNRSAEAGNRVQPGQPLFALVEEKYWIIANFKETQLEDMRVGQPVDIAIDALGGRHFTGRVESIAPSTGAQFALLPPDNATGNFTKVVQRVPVKIVFDPRSIMEVRNRLRPGLSTVVRVKL